MDTSILKQLKELKPILQEKYGIEEFAIFGSYAKGLNDNESDLDIAVLKMQIKSGLDLIRAQNFLENTLQKKVDIGTFSAMKTFVKNRIQKDFIYV